MKRKMGLGSVPMQKEDGHADEILTYSERTLNQSVLTLHVLLMYSWLSSLLTPSKNMHVRLTGNSKRTLGVSLSVHCCSSCPHLCWSCDGPVNLSRVLSHLSRWQLKQWIGLGGYNELKRIQVPGRILGFRTMATLPRAKNAHHCHWPFCLMQSKMLDDKAL